MLPNAKLYNRQKVPPISNCCNRVTVMFSYPSQFFDNSSCIESSDIAFSESDFSEPESEIKAGSSESPFSAINDTCEMDVSAGVFFDADSFGFDELLYNSSLTSSARSQTSAIFSAFICSPVSHCSNTIQL